MCKTVVCIREADLTTSKGWSRSGWRSDDCHGMMFIVSALGFWHDGNL